MECLTVIGGGMREEHMTSFGEKNATVNKILMSESEKRGKRGYSKCSLLTESTFSSPWTHSQTLFPQEAWTGD